MSKMSVISLQTESIMTSTDVQSWTGPNQSFQSYKTGQQLRTRTRTRTGPSKDRTVYQSQPGLVLVREPVFGSPRTGPSTTRSDILGDIQGSCFYTYQKIRTKWEGVDQRADHSFKRACCALLSEHMEIFDRK